MHSRTCARTCVCGQRKHVHLRAAHGTSQLPALSSGFVLPQISSRPTPSLTQKWRLNGQVGMKLERLPKQSGHMRVAWEEMCRVHAHEAERILPFYQINSQSITAPAAPPALDTQRPDRALPLRSPWQSQQLASEAKLVGLQWSCP